MADEQSTDTSTNEDMLDTDVSDETSDGDDWDDDTEAAEDDDSDDESTSDDTEEPEAEPAVDEVEEAEPEEESDESPQQDVDPEAERKRHNDEMAKARIEARQAREEAEQVKKTAERSNIEQYLKEAADDEEELKARQNDVREYQLKEERIALNTERLENNALRAVNEIELFREGTPAVRNRLLMAIDQFEAMHVVKDQSGRPVEVTADVYQYLQQEANSIRELLGEGAKQQTSSKKNQQSRSLEAPVRAPRKEKSDPMLEGFDDEANRW
jgi:hypothetical protein